MPGDVVTNAPEPEPKGTEPECKGECQSLNQKVRAKGESQYVRRGVSEGDRELNGKPRGQSNVWDRGNLKMT